MRALGSTAAVTMRVLGRLADGRPHGGNLLVVASMLAVGAVATAAALMLAGRRLARRAWRPQAPAFPAG